MSFQEQLAADLAGVVDAGELSTKVIYTPKDGSPKTINAVVFSTDTDRDEDEQGGTEVQGRKAVILTDATLGIAAPAIDDIVAIDSVDWRVNSIETLGQGRAVLSVVAGGPRSKHHEQHKHKIGS